MAKNKLKVILLLAVLIVASFFIIEKFSVYQPTPTIFTQYTGRLSDTYWFDSYVVDVTDAEFFINYQQYRFEIKKYDVSWEWGGCKLNTCNGVYLRTDEFGCGVYFNQEECGGSEINTKRECSYAVNIHKNNKLIQTLGYPLEERTSNLTKSRIFEDENIKAIFNDESWFKSYECEAIRTKYNLNFQDRINFNITPTKESYFEGENASLSFDINNEWGDLYVKTYLELCIPTFLGSKCHTYVNSMDLPVGVKTFTFEIPTEQVTDRVILKPSLELFLDLNSFQMGGLNVYGSSTLNSEGESCSDYFDGRSSVISSDICKQAGYNLISLGRMEGIQTEVQITPLIIQPGTFPIWDKIGIFFSNILLWVSGLFNW